MSETEKQNARTRAADRLVGRRIRERRRLLGLSLQALSRGVRMSTEDVREIEAGRVHARASLLLRFAGALAVPLNYFHERPPAEQSTAGRPGTAPDPSPEAGTLAAIRARYKAAGPDERRRLQQLARDLAARPRGAKPG